MLKVGVTGGIGTGKTIVCKLFYLLGIPVLDADQVAKKLLNEDEKVIHQVQKLFGDNAYNNGIYQKEFIAAEVFSDPKLLEELNKIVHPPTFAFIENWTREQEINNHPYSIKEAAIMIESGSYKEMDYIIGVQAPEDLRIHRIQKRNNWNIDEIKNRMQAQMPEEEKSKFYDFTIINDEKNALIPQVQNIHEVLLQLSKK